MIVIAPLRAQVTVGRKFSGSSAKKVKKEVLERVKQSDLVVVYPDYFDNDLLLEGLENIWQFGNVTVVHYLDFNLLNHLKGNVVVAVMNSYKKTSQGKYTTSYMIRSYMDFTSYDAEHFQERIAELSELDLDSDKKEKMFYKHLNNSKTVVARILYHDNPDYSRSIISSSKDSLQVRFRKMFKEPTFRNFTLGNFFNQVKLIVRELEQDAERSVFKDYNTDEIELLKSKTLYIPDYVLKKYDASEGIEVDDQKFKDKILSKYDYNYKFLSVEELDKKILAGEDFYYIRFTRVVSERFLEVVHSTTGAVIYNKHSAGLAKYNLSPKHFKKISKKIE